MVWSRCEECWAGPDLLENSITFGDELDEHSSGQESRGPTSGYDRDPLLYSDEVEYSRESTGNDPISGFI